MAGRIVAIGLPTGIQNMVISLSNVLIQSSVNVFGASAIAGFGAFLKVDGFNVLPILSLSMAITTFVGQNYGANRMDRVNKGVYITIAMGMAYTIVASALMLMYSEPIMRMFSQEKDVIACGQLAMWYFCPFYWVLSILHTLGGTMRGFGKSIPPMVILLIAMCLFRIVWLQTILPHFPSTDCIFVLYPVSWVLGAVMMAWYTKQTGLLRQKDTSAMLYQAA
ncbi:MAG: MATE family efflux transporter [Candidatus Bruticola sp.]